MVHRTTTDIVRPHSERPGTLLVWCGLLAFCPAAAVAQDVVGAETSPMEEMIGEPHNLPGREPAARTPEEAIPEPTMEAKPEEREWFGGKPWWKWEHASGDWFGSRAWLESKGITVEASYTLHWTSVWSGGVNQKASTRSLWDVNTTLDMEKLVGWSGASFYVDAYFSESSGGSDDVGDFQGVSNIDTYGDRAQIAEVWYEQRLFDDKLRFKLGKIDANSEFAFVESASDFLHASTGVSPTVQGLPTYPDPATGVVVFGYPVEHWYIGAGLFDGAAQDGFLTGKRGPDTFFSDDQSSDWFVIAETGLTWDAIWGMGKGRLAIGGHTHTGDYEKFAGGTADGSSGLYLTGEEQVWRKGDSEEDKEKGLFVFAQFGLGEDSVNPAHIHAACGCELKGICAGRSDDIAGAYVSFVDLSDAEGSPYDGDETAVELFYQIQITPAISLTPDLQLIFTPSGDSSIDDAVVGGVRFMVSF